MLPTNGTSRIVRMKNFAIHWRSTEAEHVNFYSEIVRTRVNRYNL